MCIFIMSSTIVPGLEKIHWNLEEELITQTRYSKVQKIALID